MSIRSTINGTFDRAALAKLLWPIAWSGSIGAEQRAAEEQALRDLVEEATDIMADLEGTRAVEIQFGQIIGAPGGADDEEEEAQPQGERMCGVCSAPLTDDGATCSRGCTSKLIQYLGWYGLPTDRACAHCGKPIWIRWNTHGDLGLTTECGGVDGRDVCAPAPAARIRATCYACGANYGKCVCPDFDHEGFDTGDMIIKCPTVSECGRFFVDPEITYGIAYTTWLATDDAAAFRAWLSERR